MNDYNKELHHEDHHDDIARLRGQLKEANEQAEALGEARDRLREELDNQDTCEALDTHEAMQAEIDRLREENASLVDRHNRESHGTASHEALAYGQAIKERDRLREALQRKSEGWKEMQVEVTQLREVAYWAKRVTAPPGANDFQAEMAALRNALENK